MAKIEKNKKRKKNRAEGEVLCWNLKKQFPVGTSAHTRVYRSRGRLSEARHTRMSRTRVHVSVDPAAAVETVIGGGA